MLRWRLLLGALLIAGLVGACWLDFYRPGVGLGPVSLIICGLACGEMLRLFRAAGIEARAPVVYLGSLSIVASGWAWLWHPDFNSIIFPASTFVACALATFVAEIFAYRRPGGVTLRLAGTIFALAYCGLLFSFLPLLRGPGGGETRLGMCALVSLVCVVKMCDIGAYTVGRLVGRRKMMPYLSPGKTIEGLAGGLAFAVAGAWFALAWLTPRLVGKSYSGAAIFDWWQWLVYGLIVGLAGVAGDLAESLLKRDLGRKDSSSWMPGFGGVLDIVDSVVFAAPVAYLCWSAEYIVWLVLGD